MSDHCIVLIAASDLLPSLKESVGSGAELLAFSDTEALRALEVVSRRRPRVVMIERLFAATPRGAALINRIKADPTLTGSEIRVVSGQAEALPVAAPATSGEHPLAPTAAATSPGPHSTAVATTVAPPAIDQRGTRRAPRSTMNGTVEVVADGTVATLVNLSMVGAQVVSPVILKPNQKLRMTLADEKVTLRFGGVVAWASFEIPPGSGPRYRAGVEFLDADGDAVEAFRLRHKD